MAAILSLPQCANLVRPGDYIYASVKWDIIGSVNDSSGFRPVQRQAIIYNPD